MKYFGLLLTVCLLIICGCENAGNTELPAASSRDAAVDDPSVIYANGM